MMSLEKKKIIVTGAASGIGAETAKTLKERGTTVIGVDRNEPRENAVLTHEFKGTTMGDIKYNPDGTAAFDATANQWWNGEQKLVYPFFEGGWKVKLAPPWDKR